MNFLLLFFIAVILLALVIISFILNSSFAGNKGRNVTSGCAVKDKEPGCGCGCGCVKQ